MHIGRHYTLKEFLIWTRRDIYVLFVLAILPVLLFKFAGFTWLAVPWVPVALVGTVSAFIVGFKKYPIVQQALGGKANMGVHRKQ